ncbi:hypothetical protein AXF42_Ash020094 [Apostasia shenzhenica]|uniref:Uncharacterized protein n=1 Tax=Apostasia shenzhenica TaxID=1088818 RepID=A0A2I0APS0_9ASPA|nr:hypothetical protein AXF42_Ash020094 [Apostasia shenzhenica]
MDGVEFSLGEAPKAKVESKNNKEGSKIKLIAGSMEVVQMEEIKAPEILHPQEEKK